MKRLIYDQLSGEVIGEEEVPGPETPTDLSVKPGSSLGELASRARLNAMTQDIELGTKGVALSAANVANEAAAKTQRAEWAVEDKAREGLQSAKNWWDRGYQQYVKEGTPFQRLLIPPVKEVAKGKSIFSNVASFIWETNPLGQAVKPFQYPFGKVPFSKQFETPTVDRAARWVEKKVFRAPDDKLTSIQKMEDKSKAWFDARLQPVSDVVSVAKVSGLTGAAAAVVGPTVFSKPVVSALWKAGAAAGAWYGHHVLVEAIKGSKGEGTTVTIPQQQQQQQTAPPKPPEQPSAPDWWTTPPAWYTKGPDLGGVETPDNGDTARWQQLFATVLAQGGRGAAQGYFGSGGSGSTEESSGTTIVYGAGGGSSGPSFIGVPPYRATSGKKKRKHKKKKTLSVERGNV